MMTLPWGRPEGERQAVWLLLKRLHIDFLPLPPRRFRMLES